MLYVTDNLFHLKKHNNIYSILLVQRYHHHQQQQQKRELIANRVRIFYSFTSQMIDCISEII